MPPERSGGGLGVGPNGPKPGNLLLSVDARRGGVGACHGWHAKEAFSVLTLRFSDQDLLPLTFGS